MFLQSSRKGCHSRVCHPPQGKSAVPAGPHRADQRPVQPVACDESSESIGLGRTRSGATKGACPQKLDGAPSRRQSWRRARQNAARPGTRGPPHSFCPADGTTYSQHRMPHPANWYNPESAGSQAPGPDVCTRRRRSDIPCRGGQYVLTVVSRHYVACEH